MTRSLSGYYTFVDTFAKVFAYHVCLCFFDSRSFILFFCILDLFFFCFFFFFLYLIFIFFFFFFFSSRRRHTRSDRDWSSDVCSSDLIKEKVLAARRAKIEELILPAHNEKNVKEDIQPELLREIKIHYVKTIEEVLNLAFEKPVLRVVPTEPVQQAI